MHRHHDPYTGDKEFETALKTKVQGGNAPDIAIFPQPGLLQTFATGRQAQAGQPDALTKEAEQNWTKDWISYGTRRRRLLRARRWART